MNIGFLWPGGISVYYIIIGLQTEHIVLHTINCIYHTITYMRPVFKFQSQVQITFGKV